MRQRSRGGVGMPHGRHGTARRRCDTLRGCADVCCACADGGRRRWGGRACAPEAAGGPRCRGQAAAWVGLMSSSRRCAGRAAAAAWGHLPALPPALQPVQTQPAALDSVSLASGVGVDRDRRGLGGLRVTRPSAGPRQQIPPRRTDQAASSIPHRPGCHAAAAAAPAASTSHCLCCPAISAASARCRHR